MSGVCPSASASYDSTSRWRITSGTMSVTSSGSTYVRPRSIASAFAPSIMQIVARGLAPNVRYFPKSLRPKRSGSRVAATSFTAYVMRLGSTYTLRHSRCSAASC